MRDSHGKEPWFTLSYSALAVTLSILCCLAICVGSAAAQVIVQPKFGGQIIGYSIDPCGTEGLLAEYVALENGKGLVAVESFDQATGAIIKVIAKLNNTLDDFAVPEIDGCGFGLVLFQDVGNGRTQNKYGVVNPLDGNKFTGVWTPPIKENYALAGISVTQGTPEVAVFQSSLDIGLAYVFKSDILNNTFGPQISLAPIIQDTLFLEFTSIALDTKTNEAVLVTSDPGCGIQNPLCAEYLALVNLTTGNITEWSNDLGIGGVQGLAVDPATGIACTTTAVDQGVEFYNLAKQTGFEVTIPNSGSSVQAGLDVELDSVHQLFLTAQWSSDGGNPQDPEPQVYVYDESGNVVEAVAVQRIPVSPSLIAINPNTRTGFLPVIVEPQNLFLQLQSFTY